MKQGGVEMVDQEIDALLRRQSELGQTDGIEAGERQRGHPVLAHEVLLEVRKAGSAASGWKSEYTDGLVADKNALVTALGCHQFSTWTNTPDTVGTGETRPIDCVTWYEAQAFCIWDGGRLPTEAEWNYVAAGSQQRVYPWSVPANKVEATCAQASGYLNDTVKCCAFTETPAASVRSISENS